MNGLALAAALALAQTPAGSAPREEAAASAPEPAPPGPARATERVTPAAVETEPAPQGITTTAPRRRRAASTATKAIPTDPAPVRPERPSTPPPLRGGYAQDERELESASERSRRAPTPTATPTATRSTELAEAERAARTFLEALARGDANALAQLAGDRFSFDGEVQAGREAIRRTWRDLLAARPPAAPPAVGALEVLHAPDALSRFGRPPARIAPLVRQGVTIAIGDVGGRTVVLFVAREGGRMAVLGMHD